MKQSGTAERAWTGRWPAWLVVHERLPAGAVANALFVAGILGYGATFAWYMVDRFDIFNLMRDMSYDDAFYYYQIAYHMAEGKFSTFDGGLTRTNGYQPLWLFLLTPFYWLFDKTEALFVFKALEIMLLAGGVALVAVAARVARLPWFLLFAVPPALYAETGMLFGLEAALVLFMLGLLLLAMCLFAGDPARWRWPLSAVAFALPWARLECAAVAVAATAALCFLEWSGRSSCARDGSLPSAAGRADWALPLAGAGGQLLRLRAVVPLAGAFAGVLVYFAYNGIVFGGMVPVSGAVKALLSQREWEREGGYGLAESFEAFARSEAFDGELLIALEVCVYALLVWWLARGSRSREDALLLAFAAGVLGLAAGHLAKFAHDVLFMHPNHSFRRWYYVPAYLMGALVVPLRCCVGIYLIRRFVTPKLPRSADVLRLAAIAAAAVVLATQVDFAAPFRFVDDARARDEVDRKGWQVRSYMGVAVMDRLLPEGTLVGSWDAGAIGYFSRLPVMNMDGMVNSYGYKEAIEEESVGVFWQRHGLFHFGNVYGYGYDAPDSTVDSNIRYLFKAARGSQRWGGLQFKLYRNDPTWTLSQIEGASWFRERIAPHLEPQAEGVGLLVVGRTAQAFAWNCTADANEVAEWTFGGKVGAVTDWTQTAEGVCSSDILLPHGHLDPVRVRRTPLAEAVAALAGGRPPAIQADSPHRRGFDVYVAEDALVYVNATCEQADVDAPFFLHVVPAGDDFDDGREVNGYNNLDFHAGAAWRLVREAEDEGPAPCLAEVPLPEYGIAEIRTGQYSVEDSRRVWQGEIHPADDWGLLVVGRTAQAFAWNCTADANEVAEWTFGGKVGAVTDWTQTAEGVCSSDILLPHGHLDPVRVRRTPLAEAVAALAGGRPPAIQADSPHRRGFDVYVAEDALVYVNATCEQADVETPFFLHVVPAGDDFDDGREVHGFNNLDFMLARHGDWFGEAEDEGPAPCLAEVPLPEYGIAEIRTGQYSVEDSRRVWQGEIHPADDWGLLVVGRTAQAFAWNCTADANEVAEWTFGGKVGAVTDWTQTAEGVCSSDILLPHGHLDPVRVRRAPLAEAVAGLAGGEPPAIRGDKTATGGFDIYLAEDALVYVKAACERADVETPFFLHVVPAGDDFDDGREAFGFNNLDFMLARHGDWFGEAEDEGPAPCLAEVPLPEYGIAEIRTGQYSVEDSRRVWQGEIHPADDWGP